MKRRPDSPWTSHCIRFGFTKNRVLPLPEPPMTNTFLFRDGLGVFGAVVHGEAFRLGQENVVIKHRVDVRGDIFGAAPTGTAVFYAFAVFLGVLALAVHQSDTMPPHRPCPPPDRTGGSWGRHFQRQKKSRLQGARAFPTSPPQPPAGRSVPACQTGKQTADMVRWTGFVFLLLASQRQPPFLDFLLGPLLRLGRSLLFQGG